MPRRRNPLKLQGSLAAKARSFRQPRNPLRAQGKLAAAARAFQSSDPNRPKSRRRGGHRGRKKGTKVTYNDYQTRRYQSIWLRTERARRLQPPTQLEAGVFQFRSKRKRVKPYRTTTAEGSLAPITSFPGTVSRSGNPPDCPLPTTFYDYLNPFFRWAANGIHDCSKDNPGSGGTGGGNPGTPAGPGDCPGEVYDPPVGQSATVIYAYWSHPDDGIPQAGIPFPLNFNWGCGTTHTAESPPDYPAFGAASDPPRNLTYLYYRVPERSEEFLLTITLLILTYTTADLPLEFPPGEQDSPFALIENYTSDFAFCEPANADPDRGYCPASDGDEDDEDDEDDGDDETNLATAGIEAQSNIFQVLERLDIFTSIAYSIVSGMPPLSGSISLKLFTAGMMTTELSEAPTRPGAGSLNLPMTLLPGNDYQFKISIPESIYCDAAIVRLGGKFICNCPDFNRKSKAFPSKYPSELGDRDWSASGAGTRKDCKHIIYLKLITGEPIDAEPNDLKDIRQWRKDQTARMKQQRKRERQAEAQSRRDARKRVRDSLRGMKRRNKAELKALTANREYKKPKAQRFRRDLSDDSF